MNILVINAGSSSLKYQLMNPDTGDIAAKGLCERIGLDGRLTHKVPASGKKVEKDIPMPTHKEAIEAVMAILVDPVDGVIKSVDEIDAVGHRVLHGGDKFVESCIIDEACKQAIRDCIPLGPLHNPANLMGIEACEKAMPGKPQVAVFDTAFHMTMPPKAYRYAIPTKYYTEDHLRRYGFHGTSHRFVSKRCIELMGGVENAHRVIVCHLGNGSSLSAVKDGKCQDTSMGLSPLAGVPMGTRAGDIDTCVAQFIMNKYNMSADDCLTMLNKKSGVLALSDGVSSDFRDLDAAAEKGNEAAQLALDKFAYEVRKYIGAYAAALGGVDCIVFTAGVGEHILDYTIGSAARSGLWFAIYVLAIGALFLVNALGKFDVSVWTILWTSALLLGGLSMLTHRFSCFSIGLMLVGGYSLLTAFGFLSIGFRWSVLIPVFLLLWGVSLLVDYFCGRRRKQHHVRASYGGKFTQDTRCDNGHLSCELSFGSCRVPVVTPLLRSGRIETSFGDFTVDLSGCEAVQDNCPLTVETNFGSLTLLVPDRFAVTVSGKDTTAASLNQRGTPCEHPEAQILLDADLSFGSLEIKYI